MELMPSLNNQASLKRQRAQSEQVTDERSPVSKRGKADSTHKRQQGRYPPSFWDTLSKIPLTCNSLREFDRRNGQATSTPALWAKRSTPSRILRSDLRQIKALADAGGPNLNDIRGLCNLPSFHDPTMNEHTTQSRRQRSASGVKSTAYSGEFEQALIDIGIYPAGYEFPDGRPTPEPSNLEDIRETLTQRRATLSPSRVPGDAFRNFTRDDVRARSESKVMADVMPAIMGTSDNEHRSLRHIPFNNLEPFHEFLTVPKPDVYYGAAPEQMDLQVRQELGNHIVPSRTTSRPAAPNFFLEVKGPGGLPDIARRQAWYDSVAGARAMHSLQNYGSITPMCDGNAYSIASIYADEVLRLYATHLGPPRHSAGRPEYYTTQLGVYALTHSSDAFLQGAGAYRNARDWAKAQRDQFITSANALARSRSDENTSHSPVENGQDSLSTAPNLQDSCTSSDELSLDLDKVSKRRGQVSSGVVELDARPSQETRHSNRIIMGPPPSRRPLDQQHESRQEQVQQAVKTLGPIRKASSGIQKKPRPTPMPD